MNHIEKVRDEIKQYFNPELLIKDSQETFTSPNNKFLLETVNYHQDKDDVNWDITNVKIFDNHSNVKLFDFYSNDGRFFYSWVNKDSIEYLICAEDLFGGQTVIDLTNKQMSSFSPDEDGFIWTDFFLSPDGKTLATIGCFWACPFVIKFYDFNNPLNLPLIELKEVELIGSEEIVEWRDNNSIKTNGIKTEYIEELQENGGVIFKPVGETKVERIIKTQE